MARRRALAEAMIVVSLPGGDAARGRTRAIQPVIASSGLRRATGALIMIVCGASMAARRDWLESFGDLNCLGQQSRMRWGPESDL